MSAPRESLVELDEGAAGARWIEREHAVVDGAVAHVDLDAHARLGAAVLAGATQIRIRVEGERLSVEEPACEVELERLPVRRTVAGK